MKRPPWWTLLQGWLHGDRWREDWLFRQLLDASADEFFALWLCRGTHADYEIVAWSVGAEKLYGFSRDFALGKSYIRLIVSDPERAEARITTEQTVRDGIIWRNYLNRDERDNGSLVLTLTQNIRIWDPFSREFLFGEIGINVSDLFESEHALLERRNEDRLSVNEMTRLSLLGKALVPARSLSSLSDVARLVADSLGSSLFEEGRTSVWLVNHSEGTPRIIAESGSRLFPSPSLDFVQESGERRDGVVIISPQQLSDAAVDQRYLVVTCSLSLSAADAVVISLTLIDRTGSQRSRMFLESVMDTCASAVQQWLLHSELWRVGPDSRSTNTFALVEADLVASELSHIAKNRLTTIQNIVYLLRERTTDNEVAKQIGPYLSQLETEVAAAATQILHAKDGLSAGDSPIIDVVRQTVDRAVPASKSTVDIAVLPPELRLKGPSFNFETVISNLVRNGVDAATENSAGRAPKVAVVITEDLSQPVRSCIIEVHDSGAGVPEELVTGIFSGTTTKGPGHGGHGLPNLIRAVTTVGGTVSLPTQSPLLSGALFRVVYPLEG